MFLETGLCPQCGIKLGEFDSDGNLRIESEPGPGVATIHPPYARFICEAGIMRLYGRCGHLIIATRIGQPPKSKNGDP